MSLNHRTKIDWADFTWNPVWGCLGDCPYCYARRYAKRFGLQVAGRDDFIPTWIERNFQRAFPRRPSRIFVDSMSDVAWWEDEWMRKVGARIAKHPEHRFFLLTKAPERLWLALPPYAMYGYSCTDQESYTAASLEVAAGVISFLSIEPLLGPIDMEQVPCGRLLRWVIVGAETGNRRDRVISELTWLREISAYCRHNRIPLFFKSSLRHLWPADAYFPQELPSS